MATNWSLYAKDSPDTSIRLVAQESSFSDDGVLLRIGSQVFVLNEKQVYEPLLRDPCGSEINGPPPYYEEFASRNENFAFGSRAHTAAAQLQAKYRDVEGFGEDFLQFERLASSRQTQSQDPYDQSEEEYACDASSDSSSEADIDMAEGYESWSEGSTVTNQDLDSDSDMDCDDPSNSELSDPTSSDPDPEDEDDNSVEDNSPNYFSEVGDHDDDHDDHDEPNVDDDETYDETYSDGSEDSLRPPSSVFSSHDDQDSDNEGNNNIWNSLIDKSLCTFGRSRPVFRQGGFQSSDRRKPVMVFSVFQRSDEGRLKKIFHYAHPLFFMLYASPPAFHPTKSLVAWPLGAGEVLFADFQAKTYFVRKLRASAPQSEYIMQFFDKSFTYS